MLVRCHRDKNAVPSEVPSKLPKLIWTFQAGRLSLSAEGDPDKASEEPLSVCESPVSFLGNPCVVGVGIVVGVDASTTLSRLLVDTSCASVSILGRPMLNDVGIEATLSFGKDLARKANSDVLGVLSRELCIRGVDVENATSPEETVAKLFGGVCFSGLWTLYDEAGAVAISIFCSTMILLFISFFSSSVRIILEFFSFLS